MIRKLTTIFVMLILLMSIKTYAAESVGIGYTFTKEHIIYEIADNNTLTVIGIDEEYYKKNPNELEQIKIIDFWEDPVNKTRYYVKSIADNALTSENIKEVIIHYLWEADGPYQRFNDIENKNKFNTKANIYVPYAYISWYRNVNWENIQDKQIHIYKEDPQIDKAVVDNFLYCKKKNDNNWELCGYDTEPEELDSELTIKYEINNKGDWMFVNSINGAAFYWNNILKKVTIEEGIEYIHGESFALCMNLEYVSIPSTIKIISSTAFKADHANSKTEIYIHAKQMIDGSNIGNDAFGRNATLYVYSELIDNYKGSSWWADLIDGYNLTLKPIFTVDEQNIVFDNSVKKINSNLKIYERSIINLETDVKLTDGVVNLEDHSNMKSMVLGTKEKPFNGVLNGNGKKITNMIVDNDKKLVSIFGNIGSEAKINDLTISGSIIIDNNESVSESQDTTYIGIFADDLKGQIKNVSFVGNIYVDKAISNPCPTWVSNSEKGSSIENCMVFLTSDEEIIKESNNKVCVVLTQNMCKSPGVGRVHKLVSNKGPRTNKSTEINAPEEDADDINNDIREVYDEQFATGEIAYWLNFDGSGYTGNYNKLWSQSKSIPVLSTTRNQPTVRIVYTLEADGNVASYGISTKAYANEGEEVKISFTEKPLSIELNGEELPSTAYGTDFATFTIPADECDNEGKIYVNIKYNKSTEVDNIAADKATKISAKGNNIIVSNADGKNIEIFDMSGARVYSQIAQAKQTLIMLPTAGMYIAKVGDIKKKIILE